MGFNRSFMQMLEDAFCDQPDCPFLEGIELVSEAAQLRLVERKKHVPDRLSAEIAALGEIPETFGDQ